MIGKGQGLATARAGPTPGIFHGNETISMKIVLVQCSRRAAPFTC